MKKILMSLLLILFTLTSYSQVVGLSPAPSSGIWVLVDTSYTVGTNTIGFTKARLSFANTTGTKITGMQFRVYYDKVAFNGMKPTVTSLFSSSNYMQYVSDSVNGNITITIAFTGSSPTFTYPADSVGFEITLYHSPAATFQYLTSIDSMRVTGSLSFQASASTVYGNDTTLNLYSYGGSFYRPHLAYHGRFANVTGSATKNLTLALEKRPRGSSGTWTPVGVYVTDTAGKFSFNEIVDTTYWDTHLYVKGDSMNVGATVSVADAQKVNQFILGQATPSGFDYYTSDVNGSYTISIADVYSIYGRLAGRFTAWPNNVQDVKFFTTTEYSTINGSTTNYTSTIQGVTNLTFPIVPGSVDSVTYYVLGMGDANGTGFHMARVTPIQIINPNNAYHYIIDETVDYDFPTDKVEVNLPELTVDEGNLVSVPVDVKIPSGQIGSLQVAFTYDSTLLQFKGMETEQKFNNWMSILNPNSGTVEWIGSDMTANQFSANDGDKLFSLDFLALKPQDQWGKSPLYVTRKFSGNQNATDLSINPTNGMVAVMRLAPNNNKIDKNCAITVTPNPTSGLVFVTFSIPQDCTANVDFYDINGKKVYTVYQGTIYKGSYKYMADLSYLTPGTYYGVLKTSGNDMISAKTLKQ